MLGVVPSLTVMASEPLRAPLRKAIARRLGVEHSLRNISQI
jgi:hypothetical protein